MTSAVISGDIIAYTSLNKTEKDVLEKEILSLFKVLKKEFNVFGRLIKGDYIEFYVPDTYNVFRVALIIKNYIKASAKNIIIKSLKDKGRNSLFQKHAVRLAVGLGTLSRLDLKKGIIDGQAIYFAGRLLSKEKTYDKDKVSIKHTLFIMTNNENITNEFIPLISLIDEIISRNTAKQSEILYYKLLGIDEKSIAKKTGRYQSTINQHSTSAGWNAIEKAVLRFEEVIKEKVK